MKVSEKKFSKFYDQQVDKVYRFVFFKVSTSEIAQDITAQAFTKAWKKFKSGANIDNPRAYVYQIARREIANYYRKNDKMKIITVENASQIIDPTDNPEQDQIAQSDFVIVQTGLSQLKEDAQNVLTWRYVDQMSCKEIAKIINKKPGTVRVMIHRALKQLKDKM